MFVFGARFLFLGGRRYMKIRDAIIEAHMIATGKRRELEPGSVKYEKLLAIANVLQSQWESEPGVIWRSRKRPLQIGAVSEGVSRYNLPKNVKTLDFKESVIVSKGDTIKHFMLIAPHLVDKGGDLVSLDGNQVNFGNNLNSNLIGASIIVPAVIQLDHLVNPNDEIKIDDPRWLVFMMAAEYARNNQTKQHQYSNIVSLAQNSMEGMLTRNGSGDTELGVSIEFSLDGGF